MELGLCLIGVEYFSDELAFESDEVGFGYANWHSIGRPVLLPDMHFLFRVDLNDGGSFVYNAALIEISLLVEEIFIGLCFLDHWNGFSCQHALIDEHFSLQKQSLKGEPDGLVEKDDVSWDNVQRRHLHYLTIPQRCQRDFVERHLVDLSIDPQHLQDCEEDTDYCADPDHETVIVILNLELKGQV